MTSPLRYLGLCLAALAAAWSPESRAGSMRAHGITFFMFWADHGPPHFHARHGDARAKVSIAPVSMIPGRLPPRVVALIVEWASLHQAELLRGLAGRPRPGPDVLYARAHSIPIPEA